MKVIRDAIGLILFWAITIGFLIVMWSEVEAQYDWQEHAQHFDHMLEQQAQEDRHNQQMRLLQQIERNTAPKREPYQIRPLPYILKPYVPVTAFTTKPDPHCQNDNSTEGIDPERRARLCAMDRLPKCECGG